MSPSRPVLAPDLALNTRFTLGRHTFSQDEIVTFASAYDPQPFHVDPAAARRSHFGGLVASGWHTAAMWMRFSVAFHAKREEEAHRRSEASVVRGPGIGFRDLRWLKPVYVGDTITFYSEIRDRRPSKGRPCWSVVTLYSSATNQHGDLVLDFTASALQETREG